MATPSWLAAVSGQSTQAGQINQFLGTHTSTLLYTAAVKEQQNTAGSGGVNSNSLYIAQSFVTAAGHTALGRVILTLGVTGSPSPLVLSLYANGSSAPTGSALAATVLPKEFVAASPAALSVPLPATITAATTYWLVAAAVGDPGNYYTWNKSNQTSGASTSSNGTTWAAQTYGLLYQCTDQSAVQPLVHNYDDAGARWTTLGYTTGQMTTLREYTVGQTAAGYLASTRTLSYSGTTITGIT